jgi:hypothetical protein
MVSFSENPHTFSEIILHTFLDKYLELDDVRLTLRAFVLWFPWSRVHVMKRAC